MDRVLILENLSGDGPAYLGTWLHAQGLRVDVRNSEAGDEFPADLSGYVAMAVLGGEMSANDDLPSLRQAERLILQGIERDVPVIGHCLGGQLMARALGARVIESAAPEVGWHDISFAPSAKSAHWFGAGVGATVFQWHYDAFELPDGATSLASSAACPHQAFAIGRHLAMQFHVELDAAKLAQWCQQTGQRHAAAAARHPTVQAPDAMLQGAASKLQAQQRFADNIYGAWLASVRR